MGTGRTDEFRKDAVPIALTRQANTKYARATALALLLIDDAMLASVRFGPGMSRTAPMARDFANSVFCHKPSLDNGMASGRFRDTCGVRNALNP